jgi:hypothetical protein
LTIIYSAEFYNVAGNSVDYYVNLAAGTTVQIYVLDINGVETWGQVVSVKLSHRFDPEAHQIAASPLILELVTNSAFSPCSGNRRCW